MGQEETEFAQVTVLTGRLSSPDSAVRRASAQGLSILGPASKLAAPALVALLADNDKTVVSAAEIALGEIGVDAVPHLLSALQDRDPEVRTLALSILGSILQDIRPVSKESVSALEQGLRDDAAIVRMAAIQALSRLGAKARDALHSLLALPPDKHLDREVAYALSRMGSVTDFSLNEWEATRFKSLVENAAIEEAYARIVRYFVGSVGEVLFGRSYPPNRLDELLAARPLVIPVWRDVLGLLGKLIADPTVFESIPSRFNTSWLQLLVLAHESALGNIDESAPWITLKLIYSTDRDFPSSFWAQRLMRALGDIAHVPQKRDDAGLPIGWREEITRSLVRWISEV